jgi:D-glycero-beta-D-manno-heptose 1-phosphate adenylyltransferase
VGSVVSRDELLRVVREQRSAGHRIALANGIFDLLHVGHVRYLKAAKKEGDILVVAVNSDSSTRSLKGPGRPLIPAAERCEILAALECVDYVTIFPEPTAVALILAVAPDVHCKGTDYQVDSVPEREAVREAGGNVTIVGDAKDHATKDLIRLILERFRDTAG